MLMLSPQSAHALAQDNLDARGDGRVGWGKLAVPPLDVSATVMKHDVMTLYQLMTVYDCLYLSDLSEALGVGQGSGGNHLLDPGDSGHGGGRGPGGDRTQERSGGGRPD